MLANVKVLVTQILWSSTYKYRSSHTLLDNSTYQGEIHCQKCIWQCNMQSSRGLVCFHIFRAKPPLPCTYRKFGITVEDCQKAWLAYLVYSLGKSRSWGPKLLLALTKSRSWGSVLLLVLEKRRSLGPFDLFLPEYCGVAWIQEYRKLARATQAKPSSAWCPKKAAVETQQQWRKHALKVTPTHLRRGTAESAANKARTL